jgi:hypothetical protein
LTIRYTGVSSLVVQIGEKGSHWKRLGSLRLDEILPDDAGCSHEFAFINGSIKIFCVDLVATWDPVDGVETT